MNGETTAPQFATARLLGFAFGAAIAALVVIADVLRAAGAAPKPGFSDDVAGLLRPIFIGIAIAQAVAIRPLQRLVRARPIGVHDSPAARLLAATIVSLALSEAIAIYGFVLFFLTGSTTDLYTFGALAAILLAVHFPSEERWRQSLREDTRSPGRV